MIVVTVFLSILNQMEFHLGQNRKENCHLWVGFVHVVAAGFFYAFQIIVQWKFCRRWKVFRKKKCWVFLSAALFWHEVTKYFGMKFGKIARYSRASCVAFWPTLLDICYQKLDSHKLGWRHSWCTEEYIFIIYIHIYFLFVYIFFMYPFKLKVIWSYRQFSFYDHFPFNLKIIWNLSSECIYTEINFVTKRTNLNQSLPSWYMVHLHMLS